MTLEIRHRLTGAIILSGEYESEKECLEKNSSANLRGAYLDGANLGGANLYGANLRGAYLDGANLRGANLRGANLRGANLRGANLGGAYLDGANLGGAYLDGANLRGANLRGAYLYGANLRGAKGYSQSHDIFREVVRRQSVSLFIDTEWVAIAQITIHTLCWTAIEKRFGDVMPSIFGKLAEKGFGEWLEYWTEEVSK